MKPSHRYFVLCYPNDSGYVAVEQNSESSPYSVGSDLDKAKLWLSKENARHYSGIFSSQNFVLRIVTCFVD